MDVKFESEIEIKEEKWEYLHLEPQTFQQDALVCEEASELPETFKMEESTLAFVLNQKPLVSKSKNSEFMKVEKERESEQEKWLENMSTFKYPKSKSSEFMKVEKERESDQEKWLENLSTLKYPRALLKKSSKKNLQIYFEGVRNFGDFEDYVLQIKGQKSEQHLRGVMVEGSDAL
ncbi:hypothetical protein Avbf_11430 [Armadillidium vulgare]|nr:hypothetical protein Avbf_11430 [Armadillidium vulgare]